MGEFNVWSYVAKMGVKVRQSCDPYFGEGDVITKINSPTFLVAEDVEEFLHKDFDKFNCQAPGCQATFRQLLDCESHYNAVHRHTCTVCHRCLPSSFLLDLHLQEQHDSFFAVLSEKKPSYQCFLPTCQHLSWTAAERRDHVIKVHKFPPDFRFDDARKKNRKKSSKPDKTHQSKRNSVTIDNKEDQNKNCVEMKYAEETPGIVKPRNAEEKPKVAVRGDEEQPRVVMRKHVSETPIRRPLSLARMGERRSVCLDAPTSPAATSNPPPPSLTRSPLHGTTPDLSQTDASAAVSPRRSKIPVRSNSCRVPNNLSFGAGVPRAFHRPRSKHWHQAVDMDMDTSTDIEKTDFSQLRNSLPSSILPQHR